MKRLCTVCGAKVANLNPKTTTCDPICTRAKKNGVDRVQQANIDNFANALMEDGWRPSVAYKEAARALTKAGQQ